MNRITKYIIFTYFLTFLFVFNVKAECSYQERKDLLNAAKNVDIYFSVETEEREFIGINPNTDEETTYMKKYNFFNLNISGLTQDLFIKIINNKNNDEIIVNYEDLKDGTYILRNDNTTDLIKYYIYFYSLNDNCFAENVHKKTINKPKENGVYYYSVCTNEKVSEHEYCKQFIDKDFKLNEYEMVTKLNEIIDDNKVKDDNSNIKNIGDFITNYWYYIVIFVIAISLSMIIIIIRKKRSKL